MGNFVRQQDSTTTSYCFTSTDQKGPRTHNLGFTLITCSDSSPTTFTYNGAGKRLSKQDSGGTIKYMYDMDKVVLERDGQETTVTGCTHEGGSLYHDLVSMKRTNSWLVAGPP